MHGRWNNSEPKLNFVDQNTIGNHPKFSFDSIATIVQPFDISKKKSFNIFRCHSFYIRL